MMQELVSLPEVIIERIRREGPLSFRDFMEMALYYPDLGYYMSSFPKLGEGGDFYTSGYLTGLFGDLLASQLEDMWRHLGRPSFTVVEYGAGTGLLCRDILSRLMERGEMYEKLNYFIIEKSGAMRDRERALLPNKVQWRETIGEIGPLTGCVFSNELVDNFSVHQVIMADELMEICVKYDNGFGELLRPAGDALKEYLSCLGVQLPRGYRAEINLEATQWIEEVGTALERGWVMTIDYGYSAPALYSRSSGTLACYHRHRVHHCPYMFIGEQDITSHVNFTALDRWGRRQGLEVCGYTNQGHFLQGLGLTQRLRELEEKGIDAIDRLRLRVFLAEMGKKFKVLIQHKGVGKAPLLGMQFSALP